MDLINHSRNEERTSSACRAALTHEEDEWCNTDSEIVSMSASPKNFGQEDSFIEDVSKLCRENGWENVWFATDIFILITGVVANVALLWLFLREKKSLSASKVLGVNLVAMDLIYLSLLPFNFTYKSGASVNTTHSAQQNNTTQPPNVVKDIFSMFNLIGCPLLLACMCIERYLAVIRPVLYLRVRKWEYRMAISAVVWAFTLCFCLASGLVHNLTIIMVPVSIIISCLFCLMLVCLGGVIWSLQKQSPAHTTHGNQARSVSLQKRRAVDNVLVVVVLAVMAYLPVLMLVPVVFYIYFLGHINKDICNILETALLSPTFGVFIGPLFYLSKARQICCLSGTGKTSNE
ncbi:hypothetical protein VZT92_016176 [Zoarces viviparus]|uniref:G-protein coupled receptors family 1 profile domain-containing protein n=1 Tax=Zoarces viviparus TaxID=48416 RepID=A0AAW1ESU2_ZOAVI